MCPQSDLDDADRRKGADYFEKDRQGQRFEQLAIKKFHRSDAGSDRVNQPSLLRPPIVLYVTMKYMRDCLAD